MERDLKTNQAANNIPVPVQQSAEDSSFFINDVWHVCDRVLQRWMPHLTFNERIPDQKNLIQ